MNESRRPALPKHKSASRPVGPTNGSGFGEKTRRSAPAGGGYHRFFPWNYHPSGSADPRKAIGELSIDLPARRVWRGEQEVDLTRKEFDLLARLVQDAGRVVTREALMSDVWDMNWFGSTKTLDVHIAWLRRKLGDDPAHPTYIHTVRGVGFRLAEPKEVSP